MPKYVAAVPKDIFSGGELNYRQKGDGYLLYSVGPNGTDDGGRNQWDNPDDAKLSGCDDIAVRVPAKQSRVVVSQRSRIVVELNDSAELSRERGEHQ